MNEVLHNNSFYFSIINNIASHKYEMLNVYSSSGFRVTVTARDTEHKKQDKGIKGVLVYPSIGGVSPYEFINIIAVVVNSIFTVSQQYCTD